MCRFRGEALARVLAATSFELETLDLTLSKQPVTQGQILLMTFRSSVGQVRAEAEARKKRLKSLGRKENDLWSTVDKPIPTKQPRRYHEAVSLLQDLYDLAELEGKDSDFNDRMVALRPVHSAKQTLIERF